MSPCIQIKLLPAGWQKLENRQITSEDQMQKPFQNGIYYHFEMYQKAIHNPFASSERELDSPMQ